MTAEKQLSPPFFATVAASPQTLHAPHHKRPPTGVSLPTLHHTACCAPCMLLLSSHKHCTPQTAARPRFLSPTTAAPRKATATAAVVLPRRLVITMVEGHQCHRVGHAHRRLLLGKRFLATSPNGRFAEGEQAGMRDGRVLAAGRPAPPAPNRGRRPSSCPGSQSLTGWLTRTQTLAIYANQHITSHPFLPACLSVCLSPPHTQTQHPPHTHAQHQIQVPLPSLARC